MHEFISKVERFNIKNLSTKKQLRIMLKYEN